MNIKEEINQEIKVAEQLQERQEPYSEMWYYYEGKLTGWRWVISYMD